MSLPVVLLTCLLSCCSGDPLESVLAFAGEVVILPCSFSVPANQDFPTVEWSKEGLKPNVVFLYRDGCETHAMKNPAFRYRTNLITNELKNGNISLRISDVQLADAGRYQCLRLWRGAPREVTAVELVVGAVSEPKLSVTSDGGGGVALRCEATCWLPEPEINFLDEQGNDAGGDEPKRDQDARGCYTVTRTLTLQEDTSRVTCRVHQPAINHTREAQLLLPADGWKYSWRTAAVAIGGVALLLLAATCGLAVLVWKRRGTSTDGQKSPEARISSCRSSTSAASEDHSLLQSVAVDNTGNVIEMLTVEVAEIKSEVQENEKTIRWLQSDISQLSAVVCQNDRPAAPFGILPPITGPKPGVLQQNSLLAANSPLGRSHRRHSSPALLDLEEPSGFPSEKWLGRKGAVARAGPNSKILRRHSLLFPSTNPSHGRYMADLPEESEMLIP